MTEIAVDSIGKLLLGLVLLAAGIVVLLLSRHGMHKLPGDIIVRRGRFTLYLPLGLMILLSLVPTIALSRRADLSPWPWRGGAAYAPSDVLAWPDHSGADKPRGHPSDKEMPWLSKSTWSSTPQHIRMSRPRGQRWMPSSTCTKRVAGTYDAAVVDKENGKAHVVKRMDHPHVRVIPEWFGGGALTRKELDEAAEELLTGEAGLIVVGQATIEPALDKALTGTAKVFKREVAATVDQITSELQEAFKDAM